MTSTSVPARRIEYLPLGELEADPRNPKMHDLDVLSASVTRFGYIEPVVLDERTGRIVSGHGRTATLTAMSQRGEVPPEGVQVDAHGLWRVPVIRGWASRDDAEAVAALVAINRSTELGGWSDAALLDILADLDATDALTGVGFDSEDIERLRGLLDVAGPIAPDAFPVVDVDPVLDHRCPSCGYEWNGPAA